MRTIKRGAALLFLLALILLCGAAQGEEARDMTGQCKIRVSAYGQDKEKMLDNRNMTMWYMPEKNAWVEITAPTGEPVGALYIRWGVEPIDVVIQAPDENGAWQTVQQHEGLYFNEYIELDQPLSRLRVAPAVRPAKFGIIKLQVLTAGETPDWAQQWTPFEGKADLMVLVAHADDELLYMGGVIPYYNTQMGKKVIVVYMARMGGFRQVELLDGLWRCGVRNYPEMPCETFRDQSCNTLKKCLEIWKEDRVLEYVTAMIRKYQPDVIVTHDVKGEYGHGAHRACAWAVQQCVEIAADESRYPASAEEYGAWQAKKVYLHLYQGDLGQIDFDWRQPLSAFDGKTAFDVTEEAFNLHRSQAASGKYVVQDYGKYDNSLFGLYYSTVGPDTGDNDLFENLD